MPYLISVMSVIKALSVYKGPLTIVHHKKILFAIIKSISQKFQYSTKTQ